MPRQWLDTLKKSRPRVAEALEDLCAVHVSKKVSMSPTHVLKVVHQNRPEEKVLDLFWECIRLRKEDYESRQKRKSG